MWIRFWSKSRERPYSLRLSHRVESFLRDQGLLEKEMRILDFGSLSGTIANPKNYPLYRTYEPSSEVMPIGSFDLVLINSVLQYVDKPLGLIEMIVDRYDPSAIVLGDIVEKPNLRIDGMGALQTAFEMNAIGSLVREAFSLGPRYFLTRMRFPLKAFDFDALRERFDSWTIERFDSIPQKHRCTIVMRKLINGQ